MQLLSRIRSLRVLNMAVFDWCISFAVFLYVYRILLGKPGVLPQNSIEVCQMTIAFILWTLMGICVHTMFGITTPLGRYLKQIL